MCMIPCDVIIISFSLLLFCSPFLIWTVKNRAWKLDVCLYKCAMTHNTCCSNLNVTSVEFLAIDWNGPNIKVCLPVKKKNPDISLSLEIIQCIKNQLKFFICEIIHASGKEIKQTGKQKKKGPKNVLLRVLV